MATTPQRDPTRDPFERAHALFGEMLAWLGASAHDADHRVLEEGLRERGHEILRAAYQGHLDQLICDNYFCRSTTTTFAGRGGRDLACESRAKRARCSPTSRSES